MEFRAEVLEAKQRHRSRQVSARPRSTAAERLGWTLGALGLGLTLAIGSVERPQSVSGVARVHDARTRVQRAAAPAAVETVHVVPGQRVERGQILMRLRDPVVEVEHAAAAKRAEQALVAALRLRGRERSQVPVGVAIDELVRTHASAQLHTIRAEHGGTVAGLRVSVGDEVEARAPLLSVREQGPHELMATIDLPPELSEKVALGDEVLVSFGAGHGAKRRFEVTAVASETLAASGDEQDGRWRVWARYVDTREELEPPQPGMQGRAELIHGQRSLFGAIADILLGTEGL